MSPPLALTSSSQIFIAKSDILPLAANGPVSAMPNPTVIGSAARASPAAKTTANMTPAEARRHTMRRLSISRMFPSLLISPHFACGFDDHLELRPLLVLFENIPFLAGGEATLRAQRQLLG